MRSKGRPVKKVTSSISNNRATSKVLTIFCIFCIFCIFRIFCIFCILQLSILFSGNLLCLELIEKSSQNRKKGNCKTCEFPGRVAPSVERVASFISNNRATSKVLTNCCNRKPYEFMFFTHTWISKFNESFSLELLEHSTRQRAPLCIVFNKFNQDHKLSIQRKKLFIFFLLLPALSCPC